MHMCEAFCPENCQPGTSPGARRARGERTTTLTIGYSSKGGAVPIYLFPSCARLFVPELC